MNRTQIIDEIMSILNMRGQITQSLKDEIERTLATYQEKNKNAPKYYEMHKAFNEVKINMEKIMFTDMLVGDDDISDEELAQVLAFFKSDAGKHWQKIRMRSLDMLQRQQVKFNNIVSMDQEERLMDMIEGGLANMIQRIRPDLAPGEIVMEIKRTLHDIIDSRESEPAPSNPLEELLKFKSPGTQTTTLAPGVRLTRIPASNLEDVLKFLTKQLTDHEKENNDKQTTHDGTAAVDGEAARSPDGMAGHNRKQPDEPRDAAAEDERHDKADSAAGSGESKPDDGAAHHDESTPASA